MKYYVKLLEVVTFDFEMVALVIQLLFLCFDACLEFAEP